MSAHPPLRLRLALAFLIIAVTGTVVGAAFALGSNQDESTTVSAASIAPTGPPLDFVSALDENPEGAETINPGMRLGVLDKAEAILVERQARAAARAQAAVEAEQAAIVEYAAAVADAQAAEAPPAAPAPAPTTPDAPPPAPDPGGGGNGGSLYAKLDNIATCESGQNPDAYNPNPRGPWYGAFQFRRDTWVSYGGGPGDIRDYSYVQQREIAANLARARGFAGSWPTCAAAFGYT